MLITRMNKTFKVARSLTRGTVVTSEKASSYQGKAVKTVIAAAVASLVAGAAMAADTPADGTILIDGITVVSTDGTLSDNKTSIQKYTATTSKWDKLDSTAALATLETKPIQLANGSTLSIEAKTGAETATLSSLSGNGTLVIKSVNKAADDGEAYTNAVTLATGGIADTKGQNLTVKFDSVAGDKAKGEASLTLTAGTDLGYVDANDASKSSVATVAVTAGTKAKISANTLNLVNANFQNAGVLTLEATNGINVNSSLDTTAEGNTGDLVYAAATTTGEGATSVNGNVYFGAYGDKISDVEATKKLAADSTVFFEKNVTVGDAADAEDPVSTFKADKITLNSTGNVFNVVAGGVAEIGDLIAKAGTFTNSASNVEGLANGTVNLTNLTVDGATVTLGGNTTVTGTATLEKGSSGFSITGGKTTIGTLQVGTGTDSRDTVATADINGTEAVVAVTDVVVGKGKVGDTLNVTSAKSVDFGTLTVAANGVFTQTAAASAKYGKVSVADGATVAFNQTASNTTTSVAELVVADQTASNSVGISGGKIVLESVTLGKKASVNVDGMGAVKTEVTLGYACIQRCHEQVPAERRLSDDCLYERSEGRLRRCDSCGAGKRFPDGYRCIADGSC